MSMHCADRRAAAATAAASAAAATPSLLVLLKTAQKNLKHCRALPGVAVISAKNHKRQPVTAKREKLQMPKFLTAILTLPNLT